MHNMCLKESTETSFIFIYKTKLLDKGQPTEVQKRTEKREKERGESHESIQNEFFVEFTMYPPPSCWTLQLRIMMSRGVGGHICFCYYSKSMERKKRRRGWRRRE